VFARIVLRVSSSPAYLELSKEIAFVASQDHHDTHFNDWEVVTPILEKGQTADGTWEGLEFVEGECNYYLSIYPSHVFEDLYKTGTPWVLVSAVGAVFLFAILMFFVYDRLVERRQALVLNRAIQSSAIVSSLFPKTVRDRLMNASNPANADGPKALSVFRDKMRNNKGVQRAKSPKDTGMFFPEDDDKDQTIADLFPNCTVLFADISGFTAWSSTRDPSQVFALLQNLYSAFDKIDM
jgi:hypothetical protein